MSLIDDVVRYYAERAPVYDESAGYTNPEAEELRVPIKVRYQEMFRERDVLEIACGSGYWTEVIGEVAKSVLATDINSSLISIAKGRCKHLPNVRFMITDAYTLQGVPTGFDAALGIWWWSHIPLGHLQTFLATLHSKLAPEAIVMFVDQLPYDGFIRKQDDEGNTLEQRILPGGRSFMVVKNFPTEREVKAALAGIADDIQYTERPGEQSWDVRYKTKKNRQ
jgi:demethylmenaquinone methyltransferase/2-methoxy-6-polyprenyl-1,4-benzoquinol methylase